jgi:hypothetical protein
MFKVIFFKGWLKTKAGIGYLPSIRQTPLSPHQQYILLQLMKHAALQMV